MFLLKFYNVDNFILLIKLFKLEIVCLKKLINFQLQLKKG